jgi:photosystem II stability/assembly factor-like uncharacterized protein
MPKTSQRTLILLFILLLLLSIRQGTSAGRAPNQQVFLPLIEYDITGWIGPDGGTVVPLAIDPSNSQIVYAGSYGSGVYKSLDGGNTWKPASQGLTNLYVYSLAIDPNNPFTLYAGTYHGKVYKSMDGGNSWSPSGADSMQEGAIVYSIAIDPVVSSNIYAATRGISNNGNPPWRGILYRSTDGGNTWQPCLENLGGSDIQDWVYSVTVNSHGHKEVFIATHQHGLFHSTDYGEAGTWQAIFDGISGYSGRSIVIAPQPNYPITCFYGGWDVSSVFKSTTGCTSWKDISQGWLDQHIYSISINPHDANNVFLSTFRSGILKSTNGGDAWQPGGLSTDNVYSVAINPNTPSHLIAGTSGDGIFRSEDSGNSWQHSNNGINNATVTSVVNSSTDADTIYASLFGGGVYQYNYRDHSWKEINTGLADRFVWGLVMDPSHPGWLYAITDEGGLFKNDLNSGNGWVMAGIGLPQTGLIQPAPYSAENPLATLEMQEALAGQPEITTISPSVYVPLMKMIFAPSNSQIAYIGTAGSGVYRSNDGGQSWAKTALNSGTIVSLTVDHANSNLVYAATNTSGSIVVTADGGRTWNNVYLPLTFYSLAASPVETGALYAGTNNGLYRYQYGSWSQSGLSNQSVTAIALDLAYPDWIYAGSESGAYYSSNSGQTWTVADENLNGQTIEAIDIDSFTPTLIYFSTKTHGIFLLVQKF